MAPCFDSAVSSLLCTEESISFFCDETEYGATEEEFDPIWDHQIGDQNRSFGGGEPELMCWFPMQSDECLASMLSKEREHLPAGDYLSRLRNGGFDLGARKEAIDWIGKVHAYFNFGPLCAYLSISYLDRFLSAYDLPKGDWRMQLLAVACISIAAKMDETEVPLCLDLQVGDPKYLFEAKTIQKMELLVLSTLKWRMQAITPFSFLDLFIRKMNGDGKSSCLMLRSTQLILNMIRGINFMEFRPSEVAAAVALYVSGENQIPDEKSISLLTQYVEKERLLKCVEMVHHESSMMACGSMKDVPTGTGSTSHSSSIPQSPIGVLDAACLSYKTDGSSCPSSSHSTPDAKRRKLNKDFELEEI